MTNSIDVTINSKVFEVSIVIKDDKGQRVRLPKNFFKNADPTDFVNLSQNLLKTLEKRTQITWVDGKGVVYKKNPDAPEELSDKQKMEWDKVEDCVLKRFFSLPSEAFDEEDVATELDTVQPVATGTSPTGTPPRSSAATTSTTPVIPGRPQVGLEVKDGNIVSPLAQTTASGAPRPTTQATHPAKRTIQDTGSDGQAAPLITVPQIPAHLNHHPALTQEELLEAQANAALERLNQQVAAQNLAQTTGAAPIIATQTPVTVSPTPVTTPTAHAPTHPISAPTRTPDHHYAHPAAPTIQTPSYLETVHKVVDTFLDWVLHTLHA